MDRVQWGRAKGRRRWHENFRLAAPKTGCQTVSQRLRAQRKRLLAHPCRVKKARRVKRLEPIPDAEDRLDVLVGVRSQLLAQAADMNVQRAGSNFRAIAPNPKQQSLARDDLPRVLHEKRQ